MKYLVTGAAGFIGFHTAKRLLNDGHEVVSIDHFNNYLYSAELKEARAKVLTDYDAFTLHRFDYADADAIKNLFAQHEFFRVIHLGAQPGVRYSLENPYAYVSSNVTGFLHILEGCRHQKCPHLVYASSSSVYGLNTEMPFSVSHNVDHPISLYAATKKSNELMAHTYSHLYHLPTTGLRFFTVYGPWGRPDMAVFRFTKSIDLGQPIDLYNQGQMKRDFTFIDDIVEGVLRITEQPASPNPDWKGTHPDPSTSIAPYRLYNIGNQQPVALLEFVETLETILNKKAIKRMLPLQPGDLVETSSDTEALQQAVGFSPKTSLSQGLTQWAHWYQQYRELCLRC